MTNKIGAMKIDPFLIGVLKEKRFQEMILDMNRSDQLFEDRVNSLGVSLADIGGGYSPATEQMNLGITFSYKGKTHTKRAGDAPTLYDSGDFYESFTITFGADYFEINADPIKDDGTNLFQEWGEDVLGLTEENFDILIEAITPPITIAITEWVLQQAA